MTKHFYIPRPLRDWFPVRKWFKFPGIKYRFYSLKSRYELPYFWIRGNKIFFIDFHELEWKSKYDDYRHEQNPYICIGIANRIFFVWEFTRPKVKGGTNPIGDTAYWEAILMKKDGMPISEVYENNIWKSHGQQTTILPYLTKYGIEEFEKK